MLNSIISAYNQAVFDIDKEAALEVVSHALQEGISPEDIVFKVVVPATEELMSAITRDPDANLAQHFLTAQIAAEITQKMLELFQHPPQVIGRVVIGTARGDLHSLGKRIVMGCLKALMVETIDLGVNVEPERFVESAVEQNASIIAISSMMVHTAMGEDGSLMVRRILRDRGLEKQHKIVVGGAPYRFDPELYLAVGADAWAPDAVAGGKRIVELIQETRQA